MAQLRLARAKLTEQLGNRSRLHTAAEQFVQLLAAGRQVNNVGTLTRGLSGSDEAHGHHFRGGLEQLVSLGLGDTLDLDQLLLAGEGNRFDCVESRLGQLLEISGPDAVLLPARGAVDEDAI